MLPWSQWLLDRGYSYFSEGIAALGAAVLYLSIWAGCHYYTLFTRDVGFVAMIVVYFGDGCGGAGKKFSAHCSPFSFRRISHAGARKHRQRRASRALHLPAETWGGRYWRVEFSMETTRRSPMPRCRGA
jgi:hypothetical protein